MGRSSILGWAAAAAFVVSISGSSAVRAAEPKISRTPEFVDGVNSAIDRGVAWLRGAQRPGGGFNEYATYTGGMTALAYYTLRVCGVPREDPTAVSAFDALRQSYVAAKRVGGLRTYSVALMCMAVAEHGTPTASADLSGERLMTLSKEDTAWMQELVKLLEDWQDEAGRWSYPAEVFKGRMAYDHSNTQYAMLGLKAASRAGVKARKITWRKALNHLLDAQEDGGTAVPRFVPFEKGKTAARAVDRGRGWGYADHDTAYGSMTAGGVASVVICRSELLGTTDYGPGLDAKAEQSARDGLAWLGLNFSVKFNPHPSAKDARAFGSGWHYYYVYALERAGVLSGVEWMGDHDWYGEGADFLLKAQLGSGAWVETADARMILKVPPLDDPATVLSTCFALLFLKKGTAPVSRGALTKNFDDDDINFGSVGTLSAADFDDFVDLVLSRWRRATSDELKERLFARTTAVGPRIVVPLVLRLASTKDPDREGAIALLKRATGLDNGYDAHAAPEAREDAIAKWQMWWLANEKTARFDTASGRIVAK